MSKRIIQDIILKKRPVYNLGKRPKDIEHEKRKKINFSKFGLWIFVAFVFFFLSGMVLDALGSIEIMITPRQKFVDIDSKIKAFRGEGENKGNPRFEIMKLEYAMKKNIPSSGTKTVEKKASGKIIVYNTYNSKPQVLIEKTRFETPDGKTFLIKNKITVPGAPGSIEVMVYADEPGEEYNIGLADFTIPGFKGGPKYKKFYARSKTEMKGGYVREAAIASKEDIEITRLSLRDSIENYFKETMTKQNPKDFLLYDGALKIDFSPIEHPNETEVEEKGFATGFLLNRSGLSDFLAEKNARAEVANLEALDFTLISSDDGNSKIIFNLKGIAHFVWKIDEESLAKDLIGAKDDDYESIFKKYSDIEFAEIIFKPSWWRNMPKNPPDIKFNQILKTE